VVGSMLQTAAEWFSALIAARLIGGIDIGMLSMACPLCISEISPPETGGYITGPR
jgi:predicted MFS family arabinose efflux permease